MAIYEFTHPKTQEVFEVFRPMSQSNEAFFAPDGVECNKVFSSPQICVRGDMSGMRREIEHQKITKDPERARKKRRKLFGSADVDNIPKSEWYQKHKKIKSAKHGEISKKEFVQQAARNDGAVKAAQEALKKNG